MSFFWPTKLNPEPNALVRFGRVLHWIGAGLSALLGIGMVFTLLLAAQAYSNHGYMHYSVNGYLGGTLMLAIAALLINLAGRALRYIFSGE